MKQASRIALLALAVLAACSDNATSPVTKSIAPTSANGTQAPVTHDTLIFAISINPKKLTVYNLGGGNELVFPANSLCDPSSLYGPAYWDQPCAIAKKTLNISVKVWLNSSGNPQVDFTPSVRFVPTDNPAYWVILTFADAAAAANPMYNIDYCASPTSPCYDESTIDPSLATYHDPVTGKLTRRVKHFSGYNVAAGDYSDPSSVSMNLESGSSILARRVASGGTVGTRSGFMLASGRQGK